LYFFKPVRSRSSSGLLSTIRLAKTVLFSEILGQGNWGHSRGGRAGHVSFRSVNYAHKNPVFAGFALVLRLFFNGTVVLAAAPADLSIAGNFGLTVVEQPPYRQWGCLPPWRWVVSPSTVMPCATGRSIHSSWDFCSFRRPGFRQVPRDDFTNSIQLTGASGTVSANNANATADP